MRINQQYQASYLWQPLKVTSVLESEIRDTVDWGKNWCVDFNAGKAQLVLFNRSNNNSGANYLKLDRCLLFKKKAFFKMLGLSFSSKLD